MTTQSPIPSPIPASNSGAVPAVREYFARRLKELRIPRGYPTARSLSRALGIDENRYTRYERAEVEPDLSLLLKICGLLRASPNDLLVPAGFDDQQSLYQAEPISPAGPAALPPRAQASTAPAAAAPADPQRRRAIMWQLASEVTSARDTVAHAGRTTPQPPLARMQRINRCIRHDRPILRRPGPENDCWQRRATDCPPRRGADHGHHRRRPPGLNKRVLRPRGRGVFAGASGPTARQLHAGQTAMPQDGIQSIPAPPCSQPYHDLRSRRRRSPSH
jgi:transcriptional regulator with XRE-family HTH domain